MVSRFKGFGKGEEVKAHPRGDARRFVKHLPCFIGYDRELHIRIIVGDIRETDANIG